MSTKKVRRAPNFVESEKIMFVCTLLPKYKDIIECKKTDSVTRREKAKAWTSLTNEFNSLSNVHYRSELNMKNLWDTLKKHARKANETEELKQFKTDPDMDDPEDDEKVLSSLEPSCVGLSNPFAALVPDIILGDMEKEDEDDDNSDMGSVSNTWAEDWPTHARKVIEESIKDEPPRINKPTIGVDEVYNKWKHKRRRRALPPNEEKTFAITKLCLAKLKLVNVMRENMELEKNRQVELFEIDKRKKMLEEELLRLQVMKLQKELGVNSNDVEMSHNGSAFADGNV